MTTYITVAFGDGIGPEITEAALHVMREAGAALEIEAIEVGQRIYNMGGVAGILPSGVHRLQKHPILFKAPTAVPGNAEFTPVTESICRFFGLTEENRAVHANDFIPEISVVSHIGENLAIFEPGQDVASKIAGKNKSNPSGMLLAGVMMLSHIGQRETAGRIEYAWRQTLAEGIHTADIYARNTSRTKVGTREFAAAVVERLPVATIRPLLYNPAI